MSGQFEVWALDSGNRIFASPSLGDALAWVRDYRSSEGDAALGNLSLGDERDAWVISGEKLREVLAEDEEHGRIAPRRRPPWADEP